MPFWCSKAALWGVVGVTAAAVTTGSLVAAAFVVHYKKESDTAAAVKLIRSSEIIFEKDDKEEEEVDEEEEKDNLELAFRRAFIRRMAREAWDAYCQAAWGQDVVVPGRRRAFNFAFGPCSGHSLVTAMSTLWLLDLKSEFARARRWVVERFTGDSLAAIGKEQWELAPTVADYLGSFLAVYALTGDRVFLEKAVFVARALAPAYETSPTGIPYPSICLKTGVTQKRTSRAAGDSSETSVTSVSLSSACAGLLELPLLSDLTGDGRYRGWAEKIITVLVKLSAEHAANTFYPGLLLNALDVETGAWSCQKSVAKVASLFHAQAGCFQGLLKSAVQQQTNESSTSPALQLYKTAMDAATAENRLFTTEPSSGRLYAKTLDTGSGRHGAYLEVTGAYLGALLSLGASFFKNLVLKKLMATSAAVVKQAEDKEEEEEEDEEKVFEELMAEKERIHRHRRLARELTETYHWASSVAGSGLPPWRVYFQKEEDNVSPTNFKQKNSTIAEHTAFNLGPELAESYFTLWRLTGERRWREYAWSLTVAIYEHCRVQMPPPLKLPLQPSSTAEEELPPSKTTYHSRPSFGYSQLECSISASGDPAASERMHPQPAAFLGATLKYLYLTQLDKPKKKKSGGGGGSEKDLPQQQQQQQYLPLEEWVFNSAGQPLPISSHYRGLDKLKVEEEVKSAGKCTVM